MQFLEDEIQEEEKTVPTWLHHIEYNFVISLKTLVVPYRDV